MVRYATPLRYPGGKQRIAPFFRDLIAANGLAGCEYAEPYAGGAGVAMDLLLDGVVSHVHLNDSSEHLYAFWKSVISKTEEFCRRILRASLTIDEWRRQREIFRRPSQHSQIDVGFSMFFLNRCNRSGIPTGGVIGGLKQIGEWKMDARFPRNELIRRIEAIAKERRRITVTKLDAEAFVSQRVIAMPRDSLVYCDPPYFKKADRLYTNHYAPEDHKRIAKLVQKSIRCHWVVSYDNVPEVLDHYGDRRSTIYNLQYNAGRAYKGREVVFFSDELTIPRDTQFAPLRAAFDESQPLPPTVRRSKRLGSVR